MPRLTHQLSMALILLAMLSVPCIACARQPKAGTLEKQEYLDRRIYENELINQRLNWLLASQSLLFAGYGAVLSASLQKHIKERVAKVAVSLGAASAFLIWLGIIAALGASISLTAQLGDEHFTQGLRTWTNLTGWSVPFFLPLLFIGAWVMLPTTGLAVPATTEESELAGAVQARREPREKGQDS